MERRQEEQNMSKNPIVNVTKMNKPTKVRLERITEVAELIDFLTERMRACPTQIMGTEALASMFEWDCANIRRNQQYEVTELPLKVLLGERSFLERVFAKGCEPKNMTLAMMRFVSIANREVVLSEGADAIVFEECVLWFLEALGWEKTLLRASARDGEPFIASTPKFDLLTGRKVRVRVRLSGLVCVNRVAHLVEYPG
jgi:hypothetical protein